ncbi:MaoC/PaaZ C-terminal domain-containing protein [Natrarchaeobius sp. A-rgal3]|uniref:FAS1-like dehydratase domain-containing protein n=1 Tax=Natrarchaeobius versutus TaxID=1679078 RepID=UPI00350FC568
MSVDPSQFEGRTFDGGSTTLEPWLAYLWTDATADSTAVSAAETGWNAPPSIAVAIAREAAVSSTIEETLRGDDWSDLSVFLGGHRFSFARPIRVGETYEAQATVTDVTHVSRDRGSFHVVTVTYDVTTDDGEPAYDLETDLIVRGDDGGEDQSGGDGGDQSSGEGENQSSGEGENQSSGEGENQSSGEGENQSGDENSRRPADDDAESRPTQTVPTDRDGLSVGDTIARREIDVDPSGMQLLSAVLRDPNPIHFDPAYAETRGHSGRVNQGPINAEYLAQTALEIGESPADLRTLDVRYESFVHETDTVTTTATLAGIDHEASTVELELTAWTADGTIAVTGAAVVAPRLDRLDSVADRSGSGDDLGR